MGDGNEPTRRHTVLVVDDAPENIDLVSSLLRPAFRTTAARSGEEALRQCTGATAPDLILLDVVMPGMDGYEVCRRLKAEAATAGIPVIFITARNDVEDEQRGFDLGAVDYITKPISPPILTARVRTHLRLKGVTDFLRDKSEFLEQEVQRRTRQVNGIQDALMVALGSLAETRDNETGGHIRRTQHYVRTLALRMSGHSSFATLLPPQMIDLLYKSAPLHDIGKVGIPDRILLKPGKLTTDEFEIMKTHTTLGSKAILAAERLLESPMSFLGVARDIAQTHHEKWNGSGYPSGLAADRIPLCGRLMAVVDVYDALISARIYKPALSHDSALQIIREGRSGHFDPRIVDGFLEIAGELPPIARRFAEDGGAPR